MSQASYRHKRTSLGTRLLRMLRGKKPSIQVGFIDSSLNRYPTNDITPAQVALYQEFGTRDLAPTLFFSKATQRYSASLKHDRASLIAKVNKGLLVSRSALNEMGKMMADEVVSSIDKEGLIDTGVLRNSVDWSIKG